MPVARLLIALVPALVVAAGNWVVAGMLAPAESCTSCLAWLVAGPVLLALLVVVFLSPPSAPPVTVRVAAPAPELPREPTETPALRLLGALQEEGRFVDFLQ